MRGEHPTNSHTLNPRSQGSFEEPWVLGLVLGFPICSFSDWPDLGDMEEKNHVFLFYSHVRA